MTSTLMALMCKTLSILVSAGFVIPQDLSALCEEWDLVWTFQLTEAKLLVPLVTGTSLVLGALVDFPVLAVLLDGLQMLPLELPLAKSQPLHPASVILSLARCLTSSLLVCQLWEEEEAAVSSARLLVSQVREVSGDLASWGLYFLLRCKSKCKAIIRGKDSVAWMMEPGN